MSRSLIFFLCLLCTQVLFCLPASGFSRTVLLGKRFCDAAVAVCVTGSVSYDAATGLVDFHGRMGQVGVKKGALRITLHAEQRDGRTKNVVLVVPVRGKSFALVETRARFAKGWRDAQWSQQRCRFSGR